MVEPREPASPILRERVRRFARSMGWPFDRSLSGLIALACVLLGLYLRAQAVLVGRVGFGVDEASWTILTLDQPLSKLGMRPVGFLALSKALGSGFGPTESVMRILPWIAGSATVLLVVPLATRLFTTGAARTLFVAVIALHPCAIDFSREYKPYSASLALHVCLLLLALRYATSGRARDLGWLLGVSLLGSLFAQDLVFAYPSVFLVAAFKALERRRAHFVAVAGGALAIIGLLLLQYHLFWANAREDSAFWGNKYDVFFEGKSHQTYFGWLGSRWLGLATFPAFRDRFWRIPLLSRHALVSLRGVDAALWVGLGLSGLAVLAVERRKRTMLLLLLPLVVFWGFGVPHVWPFGAFRANLFALVYVTAIAACSFDVPRFSRVRAAALAPALGLVVLPLFALDPGWHGEKRTLANGQLDFPPVLEYFATRKRSPERNEIVLNHRTSCDPWRYYVEYQPKTAPSVGEIKG